MSDLRIENVVTSGTFSLDGGTWDVDNNVWLVGNDDEVVIVDAAHSAAPILAAVGDRTVTAIVLTHGHNDHITVAPELSKATGAPVLLHPGDDMLWQETHPGVEHGDLADGQQIAVAGTTLTVINTPGHSPGSSVIHVPEAGVLFSGDTLFQGGPGATGRSFSSFPTIIESIRDKIFALDPETKVYTGHGDGTTIATEAPHLEEWIKRGH
ncbi:MBL fold metallo-hydrolase [Gordonia desulfuricans]|uniref:MBL fold metallo-hydrolase n=1 Tax=Gordonia desulfuricans TaxID=89051 RepID=A0A7K3LNJ7_9ACTN|nr:MULTISPECIES: MBL fold metallo-hydrolase [Gordonia]EMP14367.1 Zn-dependent hydrolase [Gordonia sp. NB41Y]NDK89758.1 MBL fold metallo-hydrolase [Gordonia desulfuricans]WLP92828.1 MBL fold metallo-hydrolase [Gordonia sp. NB41Y]